ncbi:glycosyl hydrolase 108 family protein [Acetobacter estunensis]|uniref:glycosyl hydrolase 108 family protein n=1 Tax=Acetobacter estunensis TaxID=104097 RepID=UPI001C2D0CB1|nr:glycosyl hydrolase 108 family protein [Acetobacter estunensis]MBV1835669.1 hypothetical protein [Acetobacter estunensis]MBV1836070.1 hypothetical protein [Acetobacter estunensis]
MTAANWNACAAFTVNEERGYQANPNDPGNWANGQLIGTNMGITPWMLARWLGRDVTVDDMLHLARQTTFAIYRAKYWDVVGGDGLNPGLDLMGFDHGILVGAERSRETLASAQAVGVGLKATRLTKARAEILQGILGVRVDGIIGPLTKAVLNVSLVGQASAAILYVADLQEVYYRSCGAFPTFGIGWLNRLDRRTKTAIGMMEAAHVSS